MLDELPVIKQELTLINNTVPRFDFDDLSWGDSIKLTEAQTAVMEIASSENVTTAQMREMIVCFANIKSHLAKVCTFIPSSWVTKDAPPDLKWNDPTSFDYVKQKRIADLMKAMGTAQAAEKNE